MRRSEGFTLTEVLVTIVLFMLIIGAISSVHFFSQRAYQEGEIAAELSQNGRTVLERLTRELRQTEETVTELPQTDQEENNPDEIEFQDGHIASYTETDVCSANGNPYNVFLGLDSSGEDDYYKEMFIKIIDGPGIGQIRKIKKYDGATKEASVETEWDVIPETTSHYRIGSEYYYIRYYIPEGENEVRRQYKIYCFDVCDVCSDYFRWDDTRIEGSETISTHSCILEERIVGEYLNDLRFWGSGLIDISVRLEKDNQGIDLSTKVFGRNL